MGQLCIRPIVPVSGLAVAYAAGDKGFGLLSLGSLPAVVTIVLGVLLLDVWKYAEHRLVHAVPVLWRFHVVHHNDVEVDFTTSERHHPLEVLLGAGSFLLVVFVGGVPPVAVGVYVLIGGVFSVLTHANIRLPDTLDRALRMLLITPAVHLVHHSADQPETDSNFGIVLTLWDRMFGTYRGSDESADRAASSASRSFATPVPPGSTGCCGCRSCPDRSDSRRRRVRQWRTGHVMSIASRHEDTVLAA